jgi:transposase-like protein
MWSGVHRPLVTSAWVGSVVKKLFYLALNNISKKWTMPIRDWKAAFNPFAIQFEDRVSQA